MSAGVRGVVARVLGAFLVVAAAVALGALSRAPLPAVTAGPSDADDAAVLRLSWRYRSEKPEGECERPDPEELEELPVHMRNPDACLGRGSAFALDVAIDGERVIADTLAPAGARGDRPVFVLRDIPLAAGSHDVSVRFAALGDDGIALAVDRPLRIEAGRIVLITYDPAVRDLVVRTGEGR